jgi:hypothetical protein
MKEALRADATSMYNPRRLLGYPFEFRFQSWSATMSDVGTQEQVSRKMLALFLIAGSLGAIIMSWIAYSAMIGRAL